MSQRGGRACPCLHKITAFVTRGEALLVFRHPQAGIQLPSGTVEEGESAEEAVLREVYEETGLTEVEVLECLLVQPYDLAPERAVLLQTVDEQLTRGLTVQVVAHRGDNTHILYEEYNLAGPEPTLLYQREAWVPSPFLAPRIERHFFHLTCHAETPECWSVEADRGHRFEMFWVPLSTDPGLVAGQEEWLRLVKDKLC